LKTKIKNRENIDDIINELILSKTNNISTTEMTREEDIETDIITKNPSYGKKYREALKISVKLDVQEFAQVQPEANAKDVLVAILKDYDPDIPSPILLEMAKVILADWAAFQTVKNELVLV
jgi:hypothetical protein